MSETLEYIDSYFSGALSPSERVLFEDRCESDPDFAGQVAFFVSARAAIESESALLLKDQFDELYRTHRRRKKPVIRRMFPYVSIAAAVIIVIFAGWFYFYNRGSSGNAGSAKAATAQYINKNLLTISTTLAATPDSLELGKIAFNKKNYTEAEKIFYRLSLDTNKNIEAVEDLGIVYLVTAQYDKALVQFDMLSGQTNLHANFGPFYTAIALIQRNKEGDPEKAKMILEDIINKHLPGEEEAKEWIKLLVPR